ncbi:hypothetical protein EBB59_13010, partial [Lysobacter pythonis]
MSDGYGRSNDGFGIDRQQSVDLIVKTAMENGVTDPKQIAYMLATAQHETRNFTAPDEDFGRRQAVKLGYRGGEEYFGRGYVHLTHVDNYQKFDKLLGMNGELVKNPQLAKDPETAAKILVLGMRNGLFTGRSLDRYINDESQDLYNARRIVNGVNPKQPWSVKAAKDCSRYAEEWEKKLPNVIERLERDGLDLSKSPIKSGPREDQDKAEAIKETQAALLALGYLGKDGKPLAQDGIQGQNTEHAVRIFQQSHGLSVDGTVGPQTLKALEHAKAHPFVTEVNHPNHMLYRAIAERLPPGTDPRVTANVTLQAMENGVDHPSKLREVLVNGNDVWVLSTSPDPAQRARVDLQ